VTKRRDYRDVEVHLEFMVAKGSNSGVIFHGNHEIQILDSYGIENPNAGHCGGVYPRAESQPTYHHIDRGSPPRINAARRPGRWQTMDIIFQAARFDRDGNKTAHARFVKVVHNGVEIQKNVEVPYACGPNWDRQQYPQGPIIIQGDYGPVAVRNLRIKEWKAKPEEPLNVPPEGFTAIFNGKDLTGWHTPPDVLANWFVEDGVLKSPGLVEHYRASLVTKRRYRDFILMVDFRMPTILDSGICFRRLIPKIQGFGDMEQFNLRSTGGMGHLESYYFLHNGIARRMGLTPEQEPQVRNIEPEVGVWNTVKLTMQGRTFSAEYDGEVILDRFRFHDWMMNMEPAPILLQKHMVVRGGSLGAENPCPIEYRNVFIKELKPDVPDAHATMPKAAALPQELPLWGKGTPAYAFPLAGKEQVRSHSAQPGLPSGMNRAFSAVSSPTYSIHRPAKPNGVGLVICPGGGFRNIWIDREGHDLAIWLKDHNVTSLVLKYRTRPPDLSRPHAWQDYQRTVRADGAQAIRILRQQAKALGLQTDRIGICGFSAGGHLALSCAIYPEPEGRRNPVSGVPNFAGLFYPGIPEDTDQVLDTRVSSPLTKPDICPIFIMNARVDRLTPADKCIGFYTRLLKAGVNAELHIFGKGSHGFDLGMNSGKSVALWPRSFVAWLQDCDMLPE
jgi:acetyl esterase/lipase